MLEAHMAPPDRQPNRRASPLPATDTHTTPDGIEPTRVERAMLPSEHSAESTEEYDIKPSEQLTRKIRVSDDPRNPTSRADDRDNEQASSKSTSASAARAAPRRADPRTTDIYFETPDVLGAPERTVVAPLPPRHVDVEPVPEPTTNHGARATAQVGE